MKFYSTQHVSGINMPIIRSTKRRTAAYGVQHCNKVKTVRFGVVVMSVVVNHNFIVASSWIITLPSSQKVIWYYANLGPNCVGNLLRLHSLKQGCKTD
jgi:hypothetical protein